MHVCLHVPPLHVSSRHQTCAQNPDKQSIGGVFKVQASRLPAVQLLGIPTLQSMLSIPSWTCCCTSLGVGSGPLAGTELTSLRLGTKPYWDIPF